MTAQRVIAALDDLTPNAYSPQQKLSWLQREEEMLCAEVFFIPAPLLDMDTPLLARGPYDEVYLRSLQAQIHLEAGEITRYNNAMALHNTALMGLRRSYIRSHVSEEAILTGY